MNTEQVTEILADKERLSALAALELLDSPAEETFDRLTRLASTITDSPIALVSLVDEDRQFFKSFVGLEGAVTEARETPLSYSFCQYVVGTAEPLIIEDAREVDYLKNNKAVTELDIVGYLGVPLVTSEGHSIGSFCVLDVKPRTWTETEINVIRELASSALASIELRAEMLKRNQVEQELEEKNRQFLRVFFFAESTINNMKHVVDRGAPAEEISDYIDVMQDMLKRL